MKKTMTFDQMKTLFPFFALMTCLFGCGVLKPQPDPFVDYICSANGIIEKGEYYWQCVKNAETAQEEIAEEQERLREENMVEERKKEELLDDLRENGYKLFE